MSAQLELIARMNKAQERLERLESREQRRLITDYDWLRGWKDDFLGDVIADQYTIAPFGAGGGYQLQPNAHGGWFNMWSQAVLGTGYHLLLGNAADGFATLDADQGWTMLWRGYISHTTNMLGLIGAGNSAGTRQLYIGYRSDVVANNWMIRCTDNIGTTNIDTGVAADTAIHWFGLGVYPITGGGREVDFYLDGTQIGTNIANVPTDLLTPELQLMARGAAVRNLLTDHWAVIPRNLA